MPYLVIVDGALKDRRFALAGGTIRIGRVAGNDIVLDNASVSSGHCEIVTSPTGMLLRDIGSTNGTYVNGARVTESPLFRDDQILFGDLPAVLAGDDAPERPRPAPVQGAQEQPPFPARPAIAVASATGRQRAIVCPPDFKKRRDMRLIWVGVIVALLVLIIFAARRFFLSIS